ncbi:type II toxin-antitoxin system VapC family toxin, partial [Paracoccus rhizosphaerae]
VPVTVVLEAEWVLRSAYKFPPSDVVNALRAFGGLSTVFIDQADLVAEALDHAEAGMDFADALHLGSSSRADSFMTFDRRFAKAANSVAPGRVEEL